MKIAIPVITLVVLLVGLILFNASTYTLAETEQAIITEFGKPIGPPVTQAGLHFKTPFVQAVTRLDKRVLEWDGAATQIPTQDKLFIFVDAYARWKIKDPLMFMLNLQNENYAQSRLDDILDGETRNIIGKYPLIEIVRTDTASRATAADASDSSSTIAAVNFPPLHAGREAIEQEIFRNASKTLANLGIELLDIRFKRIKYSDDVQRQIYARMTTERNQMAEKFRSQGQGEAARILGERDRDLKQIQSQAYRREQEIKGKADAAASDIYAAAYNQSPEAYEFYQFMKTMDMFKTTLDANTTLIMSTGGDLFKYLKSPSPAGVAVGTPAPLPTAGAHLPQP